MPAVYDTIGQHYHHTRQPDPRLAHAIRAALGEARSVLNVGAGTGSYEPADLRVVAVEPSLTMIRQRPPGAAPVLQGVAEHLPCGDATFDATLAILTIHHWRDQVAGLAEMRRVARQRVVILTWDPAPVAFWLTDVYFPAMLAFDRPRFPSLDTLARGLGDIRVQPLLIPHDCQDGFTGAFWQRPEAYLDVQVRRAMSGFAQLPPDVVQAGVARLEADLASGQWEAQWSWLRHHTSYDLGYRLITTPGATARSL